MELCLKLYVRSLTLYKINLDLVVTTNDRDYYIGLEYSDDEDKQIDQELNALIQLKRIILNNDHTTADW